MAMADTLITVGDTILTSDTAMAIIGVTTPTTTAGDILITAMDMATVGIILTPAIATPFVLRDLLYGQTLEIVSIDV